MKPVNDKEQKKMQDTEVEQISGGMILDSFDSVYMTQDYEIETNEFFPAWMHGFSGSDKE